MKSLTLQYLSKAVSLALVVILFTACSDPVPATNEIIYKTDADGKWKTLTFEEDVTTLTKTPDMEQCDTLYAIILPSTVEVIDDEAFLNHTNLTYITLPEGLKSIGENAFNGCAALAEIKIPQSVTSIGYNAFAGCLALPVVEGIRYADSYLIGPEDKSLSTYTIQKGTRFIGSAAFEECEELTSITLPEGLEIIDTRAFKECDNLTSIVLPETLVTIGDEAFMDSGIENINIPQSVTAIGYEAFAECDGLPIIDGIKYADTYLAEVAEIEENFEGEDYFTFRAGLEIKEGTRFIGSNAWEFIDLYGLVPYSNATSLTVPEGVEYIGMEAFENWHYLTSLSLPKTLLKIDAFAFNSCYELQTLTIPENVEYIGHMAFVECVELRTVYCKATTPPEMCCSELFVYYNLNDSEYYIIPTLEKIYVPRESVDAYKKAYGWKAYAKYIEGYDF